MPQLSETKSHRPPAQPPSQSPTTLETKRMVATGLAVSTRSIERWVLLGILDPPMQINGRDYFRKGVMPRRGPARAPVRHYT